VRKVVGRITAVEHRGWLRITITANTGEVISMDLDADAAREFLCELELALQPPSSPQKLRDCA
jgi:hypothetical protein